LLFMGLAPLVEPLIALGTEITPNNNATRRANPHNFFPVRISKSSLLPIRIPRCSQTRACLANKQRRRWQRCR
jgi:hypothetical protein